MTRRLTRRELGLLVGSAALAGASKGSRPSPAAARRHPGVVAVARLHPDDKKRLDRLKTALAMDAVLCSATRTETADAAIRLLFSPSDVVGIKLNCLGGKRLSPRPEVVQAFVNRLMEGGIEPNKIILFERSSRELERAGFEIRRGGSGPQCYGTDNDYDPKPSMSGSIGSCYARLVSEKCTALVSFGVVKDHDLAGVSASLKNWYGVIHNPNKYHDNQCDPYVADVVRHRFIADKLRLTVLDGVTAQCHGGPAFRASGLFELGRLVMSTDPVAADVWAWRVIDAERLRRGMPSLEEAGRPPRFLTTAARYGLGIGDPDRLVEVEATS